MSKSRGQWAWGAIAAVALVACNQNGEQASAAGSSSAANIGPTPPAQPRTVKSDDAKVTKGKEAFNKNCVACHSEGAVGRVGMAPNLASKSFQEAASDAFLLATITAGREGTTMVSWAGVLKADEIDAVVAYLRSLTPTEPAKLDEGPVKGNAENGGKLFNEICTTCHGKNGAGYQESGSGTGIGRKVFLSNATNGYLRYIIKNGKSGTPMRSFAGAKTSVANLKDSEIEDVIAFLRQNAW